MSTIQTLRDYMTKELSANLSDIKDGDSLLEAGILDSMAIVKLVAYLEEQFGVVLSDDEFDPDYFETLEAIEKLIESKKS